MIISLNVFLYIYLGALFIYALFSVFNLWHMFKFGLNQYVAYVGTIVYVLGVVLILGTSFFFIAGIDWSQEITLFDFSSNYYDSPYAQ